MAETKVKRIFFEVPTLVTEALPWYEAQRKACIPLKEVFRPELLKSCSHRLPRDHSWAENVGFFFFFFLCNNPGTILTPIPYSQINCKAHRHWCSASRHTEIRIPTVNSVIPFYHCLLTEPQRPFQLVRESTHKAFYVGMRDRQGQGLLKFYVLWIPDFHP